eukprot:117-Hanusia_phi.AAC.1
MPLLCTLGRPCSEERASQKLRLCASGHPLTAFPAAAPPATSDSGKICGECCPDNLQTMLNSFFAAQERLAADICSSDPHSHLSSDPLPPSCF